MTAAAPASPGTSRASRPEGECGRRGCADGPVPPTASLAGASFALALASLLLPSAPGYDPWSWLIWGREVLGLELSTASGPAWKPLPVGVTALLRAVVGEAAPQAWLVVARAGAILAVLLGFSLARRLAGGSVPAGVAAAAGVLLVPGFVEHAAVGNAEGLLTAFLLLALAALLDGWPRAAYVLGVAAALVRVEVWPLLAGLAVRLARRDARARLSIAVAGVSVLAAWLVPELLASGRLVRSAERALVPNPGAPALAPVPALATLALAVGLPPSAALAGAAILAVVAAVCPRFRWTARGALLVVAVGASWIGIVAAMSEAGFSGEPRYLLAGAALVTVGGSAGLFLLAALVADRFGRGILISVAAALAVGAALTATIVVRADDLAAGARRVAYGAALTVDLERAVARAGGPARLLRCGRPYTGRYRGPLIAWTLGVPKRRVGFSAVRPGVALRSRLPPGGPVAPAPPPGADPNLEVRTERWHLVGVCPDASRVR